jgi:cysteine desulfurase/selenocysteine lyase
MKQLRADFPILHNHRTNGYPLIYIDNAATTHKPRQVIDAIASFYAQHNANVGRGIYSIAEQATMLYEQARMVVAHYIGAQTEEIVFTSGATEGINTIAYGWAMAHIMAGDEIILTEMEHHANIIAWQHVALCTGAVLKFIPVCADGVLDLDVFLTLLSDKTKLVSCIHTSNVLGTVNDISFITHQAHQVGAKVLIDAAQTVAHKKIDVKKIGADFLVFSGHKLFAPTGIGVLYIKSTASESFYPYKWGGGMVTSVDWGWASFKKPPHVYEAGTPPIAQAVGLAAAIQYLETHVNYEALIAHEAMLCVRLIEGLMGISGCTIFGPIGQLKQNGHLVSFVVQNIHAHDVAAYVDQFGICVRAGNHCAQPLHSILGISASVRVSFALYNTVQEVDYLLKILDTMVQKIYF